MKQLFLLIFLFLSVGFVFGQTERINSRYVVDTKDEGIDAFYSREIHPLHGFLKKDGSFYGEFDAENVKRLMQSELIYYDYTEILSDSQKSSDKNMGNNKLSVHPCFQNAVNYAVPQNFSLGSYAGYFTLEEYHAEIDNMISLFPHLISEKVEIGISIEGRPIHVLRISDNPGVDQDKPQVLYTSIHHSQEPASLSVVIFFMYYLLENYGIDDEVTYLIDNSEMYFIPMINPDGYIHNETNNPNGGGLWRKNRRQNSIFSYGVDLNRNYGYMFGYDNIGSQPIGSSPWHRGDSAFSEPETQAMKFFLESKEIKIALNWHAYGNMIIYPYNYRNIYTEDSLLYVKIGEVLSHQNNYRYGTVAETYGYQCNGDADDWGYGEQTTKNKIISLTGEVGSMSDGFWPEQDRIIPLCIDAVWMNLATAHFALEFAEFTDLSSSITDKTNDYWKFNLQSLGLKENSSFTVIFNPISTNLHFPENEIEISGLNNLQSKIDSVEYVITANHGDELVYDVIIDNGLFQFKETFYKVFGEITVLFEDDCETLDNWSGNWGLTTEHACSGSHSITDSPYSNYGIFNNKDLTLIHDIDLSNSIYAVAQFMMRYDTENNHDYVQFFASNDGGNSWTALCGNYSNYGSDDQDEGQPVYDGMRFEWTFEEINLNNYLGEIIQLKFNFRSDQSNHKDGFYFDDFRVVSVEQNSVNTGLFTEQNRIMLYPNPVNDNLFVETDFEAYTFIVYNLTGQIVFSEYVPKRSLKINTQSWQRGLYLYQIPEMNIRGKIIVEQ